MEKRGIDSLILANLISVSPRTVKHWLDGKFAPRNKNLPRIADALDVSSDYLLSRT
jgi:transcriptional regulator with XRE-family HTH domain